MHHNRRNRTGRPGRVVIKPVGLPHVRMSSVRSGPQGPVGPTGPMGPGGPPGLSGQETPTGLTVAYDGLLDLDGQPTEMAEFAVATPADSRFAVSLPTWNEYRPGKSIKMFMTCANSGDCSLDVSDLGPIPLVDSAGQRLAPNSLMAGNWYRLTYTRDDTFRVSSTSSPYIAYNDSSGPETDQYVVNTSARITALHAQFRFVFIPNSDSIGQPTMVVDAMSPVPIESDRPLVAGIPYVMNYDGTRFAARPAFRALQGDPFSLISGDSSLDIGGPAVVFGSQNLVAPDSSDVIVFGFRNRVGTRRATGPAAVLGAHNRVDADQSLILGSGNEVDGVNLVVLGDENRISGAYSLAIGHQLDDQGAQQALIQGGPVPAEVDAIAQAEHYVFRGAATGGTTGVLTSDGDAPNAQNVAALADQSAAMVSVRMTAFCPARTAAAAWTLADALLVRGDGPGAVTLAGWPKFEPGQSVNMSYVSLPVLRADTVNGGIRLAWAAPLGDDEWLLAARVTLLKLRKR